MRMASFELEEFQIVDIDRFFLIAQDVLAALNS
jgi:hypothetical protein